MYLDLSSCDRNTQDVAYAGGQQAQRDMSDPADYEGHRSAYDSTGRPDRREELQAYCWWCHMERKLEHSPLPRSEGLCECAKLCMKTLRVPLYACLWQQRPVQTVCCPQTSVFRGFTCSASGLVMIYFITDSVRNVWLFTPCIFITLDWLHVFG